MFLKQEKPERDAFKKKNFGSKRKKNFNILRKIFIKMSKLLMDTLEKNCLFVSEHSKHFFSRKKKL